jgi:hypothetical protein
VITAKFTNKINDIKNINIGLKSVTQNPDVYVLACSEYEQVLLSLYFSGESDSFREIKTSKKYVVIGCGEHVHFINIATKIVTSHKLSGYFGHLYSYKNIKSNNFNDKLLVASASTLHMFSGTGEKVWSSKPIAIDGLIVNEVNGKTILCSGELDPPNGWVDFNVNGNDGKII